MSATISAAEARKKFADIVNRVAYGDESVVFTQRGKEIAALVSMEEFEVLQLLEDYIDIKERKRRWLIPVRIFLQKRSGKSWDSNRWPQHLTR